MRINPQCKSLDTACDLFLILKADRCDQKIWHDSRIQRGLHEYVDGNVHKVVGRLLTDTVPGVMWDRNKAVTSGAEWHADFAYCMALSAPLLYHVHQHANTCLVYSHRTSETVRR